MATSTKHLFHNLVKLVLVVTILGIVYTSYSTQTIGNIISQYQITTNRASSSDRASLSDRTASDRTSSSDRTALSDHTSSIDRTASGDRTASSDRAALSDRTASAAGSFHTRLSQRLANPALCEANSRKCLQKWQELLSLPDSEALFHNLETYVYQECRDSIMGSPFEHLPEFDSPCWAVRSNAMNSNSILAKDWDVKIHCLPQVLLAGFTKSGTTDMYESLKSIPSFRNSNMKEYRFWNDNRLNHDDYTQPFSAYVEQLGRWAEEGLKNNSEQDFHRHMTVDKSPAYIWRYDQNLLPGFKSMEIKYILADTLQYFIPNVKIMLMMRDPVERTYSACKEFHPAICAPEYFHDTVVSGISKFNYCVKKASVRQCTLGINWSEMLLKYYIVASLYHVFIREWLRVFPRQQFMFIRAEDYYANRTAVVSQVVTFLGLEELDEEIWTKINRSEISNNTKAKKTTTNLPMWQKTRDILSEFYRPHIRELAALLNDEKFLWNETE